MVGNTAPFDANGHPSCSVPTDPVDDLPVGLMTTGRRFDDATVLRVTHTYERAVGGFPTSWRRDPPDAPLVTVCRPGLPT